MSRYEVGIEVNKVIKKILSEMVVRDSFDSLVVYAISEETNSDTIVSLFESYLKRREEK